MGRDAAPAVGDPDTTPDDGPCCTGQEYGSGYFCTLAPGHQGSHAAGDSDRILAVWSS